MIINARIKHRFCPFSKDAKPKLVSSRNRIGIVIKSREENKLYSNDRYVKSYKLLQLRGPLR